MARPLQIEYEGAWYHVMNRGAGRKAVFKTDELVKYYDRDNQASIVGDKAFRTWIYDDLLPKLKSEEKVAFIQSQISMEQVVEDVASYYNTSSELLRKVIKGPKKGNEARKIAMYLSQEVAGAKLAAIATFFQLGHIGSVSFITHQVRKRKREERKYARIIDTVVKSIMKQVI